MKVVSVLPNTTYATGIAVADFASYIKMTYADDTTVIDLCYNAAVQYIEGLTWKNISGKTVKVVGKEWGLGEYELDIYGTLSAIAVSYFNSSNTSSVLSLSASEYRLERTGRSTSTLVIDTTFPEVYDREDAITITLTLTASDSGVDSIVRMCVFQIGAYFYDCRANDKEPQMTVVEKLVSAIREKEY